MLNDLKHAIKWSGLRGIRRAKTFVERSKQFEDSLSLFAKHNHSQQDKSEYQNLLAEGGFDEEDALIDGFGHADAIKEERSYAHLYKNACRHSNRAQMVSSIGSAGASIQNFELSSFSDACPW